MYKMAFSQHKYFVADEIMALRLFPIVVCPTDFFPTALTPTFTTSPMGIEL